MRSDRRQERTALVIVAGVLTVVAILLLRSFSRHTPPPEGTPRLSNSIVRPPAAQARQLIDSLHDGIESSRIEHAEAARQRQIENDHEETERLRRERWETNFPFKTTYHPNLTYDPERYDPSNPATFSSDPEMEMAVKRHGYMVGFFNNPQRFTAEFEQLHGLLGEIDRAENPEVMGEVFTHLKYYHRARNFNPDTLRTRKRTRPYDPSQDPSDPLRRSVSEWVPLDGKTTWGDEANSFSNSIVGLLADPKYWPRKKLLDASIARAMRDRLIKEIPSENLMKMPPVVNLPNGEIGVFGYLDHAEKALQPGDRLLTPFP